MDEMNFDSDSQKSEDIAGLLAAGFDHRKHSLDKAAAAVLCVPNESFRVFGNIPLGVRLFSEVSCGVVG